jgi:hypothetical protein
MASAYLNALRCVCVCCALHEQVPNAGATAPVQAAAVLRGKAVEVVSYVIIVDAHTL